MALKRPCPSRTTLEPKTPESNKSEASQGKYQRVWAPCPRPPKACPVDGFPPQVCPCDGIVSPRRYRVLAGVSGLLIPHSTTPCDGVWTGASPCNTDTVSTRSTADDSRKKGVGQIIKAGVAVGTRIAVTCGFRVITAARDDRRGLTRWTRDPVWPPQLTYGLVTLPIIGQMPDIALQQWTPVRVWEMRWQQCTPSSHATTLESK
jgi:hypothetical protein